MEMVSSKSTAVENVEQYFQSHDTSFVTENAVFTNMTTGEEIKGREAIAEMLHHIYFVAFDARADVKTKIITDRHAFIEARFVGKHIGEFAGIPATGKQVDVPLCVTYDINREGFIQAARIYMLVDVMIGQLKAD